MIFRSATNSSNSCHAVVLLKKKPEHVAMLPPPFDEHLGLEQRVKRFPFQQLVSKLSIDALDGAILPM